jgi:hypothetical protein
VIPKLHSWPAPLQTLASVPNLKLRLQYYKLNENAMTYLFHCVFQVSTNNMIEDSLFF